MVSRQFFQEAYFVNSIDATAERWARAFGAGPFFAVRHHRCIEFSYRGTAQDNMAYSAAIGTVRGLHFQAPPHAQGKLVFTLRGAVLDVVVDIRRASPTYGKHVAVQLDDIAGQQLYVPPGFAHGYITLVPDCLVAYKVDAPYAPQAEGGLRWNDPALEIDWGVVAQQPVVNPRDAAFPLLRDLQSPFA